MAVCVYCGANPGSDASYLDMARALGRSLAQDGFCIVYGGASIGLMGAVADAALAAGGSVVGVAPAQFPDGDVHQGLTALRVVPGMHERKALMASLAGAFVVLPGGLGTLDETFEVLTWRQLRLHSKPLAILNFEDYFDPLMDLLERMHDRGFLLHPPGEVISVLPDIPAVLGWLNRQATLDRRQAAAVKGASR